MKRGAIVLGILTFAMSCVACQKKEATLSLLVWEGYVDPSFVGAFEEAHHSKAVALYMGSNDELVVKLRGGSASNHDVISPTSDVATSIARVGLAAALDLSKFSSYSQLSARLRDSPLVIINGQNYPLFPHLSVQENVAYGLRVQGAPKKEIAARVAEASNMVKMAEFGRDNTLLVEIWGRFRCGITPEANAVSTLIFAASAALIMVLYRLRNRVEDASS